MDRDEARDATVQRRYDKDSDDGEVMQDGKKSEKEVRT